MYKEVVRYLKKVEVFDVHLINQIIISAYLYTNDLKFEKNRLLFDCLVSKEDTPLFEECLKIIRKHKVQVLSIEDLICFFEYVISPIDRKVSGSVYTPQYIRQQIIHECLDDKNLEELNEIRIADIACGCGGFLIDVAEYLHNRTGRRYEDIFRNNLFGIDIQDYSIERTKLLLSLVALQHGEDESFTYNLKCSDTLKFDFSSITPLDVIVGNPPYVRVRNLSSEVREQITNYEVSKYGNSDLYITFFQIAIESLRVGGRLGYITMNSFLFSLNGRALREYFHRNRYTIKIIDFRDQQIFSGKNTYTCLFYLQKEICNEIAYTTIDASKLYDNISYELIAYDDVDDKTGWRLNNHKAIAEYEKGGLPLGTFCKLRHGIATLSNKTYIFAPIEEDDSYYIMQAGGMNYRIEKEICRDIVNSNRFNSNVSLEEMLEKVIFPYRANEKGRMDIIPEEILKQAYPYAYHYLQSQRSVLDRRDKGKIDKYPTWYAYGRTQSLQMPRYKLFFPKIANHQLRCVISDDPNLLLYNGIAFVSDDLQQINVVQRVLQSAEFWEYVSTNAKPYASGYVALNGDNIKNFAIRIQNKD